MKKKNNVSLDIITAHMQASEAKRKKQKRRSLLVGLLAGMTLLVLFAYLYYSFGSANAKIKSIKITDNLYLSDKQVLALAGIDYDDNFYFLNPAKIEKRFKDLEILKVKVRKLANQVLEIKIENADLLAYYSENGENYLIDSLGRSYPDNPYYVKARQLLPLLVDFKATERSELMAVLQPLDRSIINQIAEVTHYATSYDGNMLKLTMQDGNQVFLDRESVRLLNGYNKLVEQLNQKNNCIHYDSMTDSAYANLC